MNGVFHHLTNAWSRRNESNIALVHYADLLHDLNGEMQRLAALLGIERVVRYGPRRRSISVHPQRPGTRACGHS